jgi:hypothetical protein
VDLSALASLAGTASKSSLEARAGGRITLTAGTLDVTQTDVTVTATGTLTVGTLRLGAGGVLTGSGTLTGNVVNGGVVQPGGSAAGSLLVTGSYVQTLFGRLNVQLGGRTAGSQFDVLQVGGAATFDGTLGVSRIGSFAPVAGDAFAVVAYGTRSGTFQTLEGLNVFPGFLLDPAYDAAAFRLVARAE